MLKLLVILEFTIEGPPISQQTRKRDRLKLWKAEVRQAAQANWPLDRLPTTGAVLLQITYFYTESALDADNIIKPIQDAINGIAYLDDSQVTDLVVRKRNLDRSLRIKAMTPALAASLAKGKEFLQIIVADAPDPEVLTA